MSYHATETTGELGADQARVGMDDPASAPGIETEVRVVSIVLAILALIDATGLAYGLAFMAFLFVIYAYAFHR